MYWSINTRIRIFHYHLSAHPPIHFFHKTGCTNITSPPSSLDLHKRKMTMLNYSTTNTSLLVLISMKRNGPKLITMHYGMLYSIASLRIVFTCGKQKENLYMLTLYSTASTQHMKRRIMHLKIHLVCRYSLLGKNDRSLYGLCQLRT